MLSSFFYKADRCGDSSITIPVSPVWGAARKELGGDEGCVLLSLNIMNGKGGGGHSLACLSWTLDNLVPTLPIRVVDHGRHNQ